MFLYVSLVLNRWSVRVSSPVLPAPGTGQVGEGLQNSWGLEEDEDEDEDQGDIVMLEKRGRTGMGEIGRASCMDRV